MEDKEQNRRDMKVNVNHPSFISFLENISQNILSAIKVDHYFDLSEEKKLTVSYTVLNLLKNSAKVKANLTDEELKSFISVLCKKNEDAEHYEFAAVLNDVVKNFDAVNKLNQSTKKKLPPKKTPNVKEGELGMGEDDGKGKESLQ